MVHPCLTNSQSDIVQVDPRSSASISSLVVLRAAGDGVRSTISSINRANTLVGGDTLKICRRCAASGGGGAAKLNGVIPLIKPGGARDPPRGPHDPRAQPPPSRPARARRAKTKQAITSAGLPLTQLCRFMITV